MAPRSSPRWCVLVLFFAWSLDPVLGRPNLKTGSSSRRSLEESVSIFHPLTHSHTEFLPKAEGVSEWFSRRADILGGQPLARAEYLLESVRRFRRRHAGGSLPHQVTRQSRNLLQSTPGPNSNATELYGELDTDSLYWAEVKLGTPPTQLATLQVDTGSDLLWVQCSQCGHDCQQTKVAPYRASLSSSASYSSCNHCASLNSSLCPVGQCSVSCQPSGQASPTKTCQSVYSYGDGSQVLFNVQSDMFTFPQQGGSSMATMLTFGCDIAETEGLITNSKVNGLMGLGRSNLSVPSQLYAAGLIKQNAFSMCLGGFEGGGALLFGSDSSPPKDLVYTKMGKGQGDTLYNATMTNVSVGATALLLPPVAFYNTSNDRPDAIFDSGSDLIALPSLLFNAIFKALNDSISLPPIPFASIVNAGSPPSPPPSTQSNSGAPIDSLGLPTCYQIGSSAVNSNKPYNASAVFPVLRFTFAGNASLVLQPDDYIQFVEVPDRIRSTRGLPVYLVYACPFILNTYDGGLAILGEYAMRNHYFTFDRSREIIGFAALNCSTYQTRSASALVPL